MPVQDVAHTMKAARLLYSAPSFVLRGPIYIVFLVTFTGLIFSFMYKVGEYVTCRMEVKADYTRVQAPRGGYITQVYVTEGSEVKAYTSLVDIQFKRGAMEDSESDQLKHQLEKIDDAMKYAGKDQKDQEQRISGMKISLDEYKQKDQELTERIANEKAALDGSKADAGKKVAAVENKLNTARLTVADLKRNVDAAKVRADNAKKRLDEEMDLMKRQLSTITAVRPLQDTKDAADKQLEDAKSEVNKAITNIATIELELQQAQDEPKRLQNQWEQKNYQHNAERNSIRERVDQLKADIERANSVMGRDIEKLKKERDAVEEKIKQTGALSQFGVNYEGELCKVSSGTFGGTVTNVYVKAGQQVSAGEVLFTIVKDTEPKYGTIMIQNRDCGRVERDQEVQIKYDAYPFQDWRTFKGRVSDIAIRPSEVKGQESTYEVRIKFDPNSTFISKNENPGPNEKRRDLTLGLQGFAEIRTKQKPLIVNIFGPLKNWFAE
jgi:multidrug resistance efflux pump